jgi:hypothetical protein
MAEIKLTDADRQEILSLRAEGVKAAALAREFKVGIRTIWRVINSESKAQSALTVPQQALAIRRRIAKQLDKKLANYGPDDDENDLIMYQANIYRFIPFEKLIAWDKDKRLTKIVEAMAQLCAEGVCKLATDAIYQEKDKKAFKIDTFIENCFKLEEGEEIGDLSYHGEDDLI